MNKYIQGAYFVTDHLILSLYYCNYLFQLHFSDRNEWPPVALSKHASVVTSLMLLISRCRYFCTARRRRGIIVPSYSHGYVLRILHSKVYLTAQSTLLFCIPQAPMPGCDLNADVYGVYCVLSSRLSWSGGEMQNAKQCIQNNACARVPNSLRDIHNFING